VCQCYSRTLTTETRFQFKDFCKRGLFRRKWLGWHPPPPRPRILLCILPASRCTEVPYVFIHHGRGMGSVWPCNTLLQSSVSWELTFDLALLSKEILFFSIAGACVVCVCVCVIRPRITVCLQFHYLETSVTMSVTLLIYEVSLGPLCCLRRLDDCRWQNMC
jgi:hypothetical protein